MDFADVLRFIREHHTGLASRTMIQLLETQWFSKRVRRILPFFLVRLSWSGKTQYPAIVSLAHVRVTEFQALILWIFKTIPFVVWSVDHISLLVLVVSDLLHAFVNFHIELLTIYTFTLRDATDRTCEQETIGPFIFPRLDKN